MRRPPGISDDDRRLTNPLGDFGKNLRRVEQYEQITTVPHRPGDSSALAAFGAVHDGLHYCVFKVYVKSRRGRLRHQDGDDLLFRIHPEVRPEGAAPAEAARGERSPSLKRITYYADTQTITEQRKLGEFLVTPQRGRFGISRKYGLTNPLARHDSSTSA